MELDIVENNISLEKSKSSMTVSENMEDVKDSTLSVIAEEFDYMEIFI